MPNEQQLAGTLARLQPYVERARQFSGWDFSSLSVRHLDPGPPWDYEAVAREHAGGAVRVLDLGTGGGERLARLRPCLPEQVVATEEWHVNVPVAHRRLASLGVEVVWARSLQLPFQDASFGLVLNRHEELDPSEVARVLRPDGWAITQQVGADHWRELRRYFPRMPAPLPIEKEYTDGFRASGLEVVTQARHNHRVLYPALGEMVFMLCVTPWTIPGFDIDHDLDALLALDAECRTEQGLVMTESYFLIVARRLPHS